MRDAIRWFKCKLKPPKNPMQFMAYDNTEHVLLSDIVHTGNNTFRGDMPPLSYNEFE